MRRFIAGFATCSLLALAGTAVAQGEGNPLAAVQNTLNALAADNERQDAQLARLSDQLSYQRTLLRNERGSRARNDRRLARCGMRSSLRWVQQADGTYEPGRPRLVRPWLCFLSVIERP